MKIPHLVNKADLFKFLKENKRALIAEKKYQLKKGDCVSHFVLSEDGTEKITKAIANPSEFTGNELKVSLVINTTGIMDSHSDVHIAGLWNKSLRENKNMMLLDQHQMTFRDIISDDVKAMNKTYTWKELGYDAVGFTQALVFNTTIEKSRNEYMFGEYLKGHVKNHSVGMQYVKLELAMNSESQWDAEEKATWDKYIDGIVNRSQAEDQGYFWAVTEAKIIEGSAVPIGSNIVTPVLSIEEKAEPALVTPKAINYNSLIKNLKLS